MSLDYLGETYVPDPPPAAAEPPPPSRQMILMRLTRWERIQLFRELERDAQFRQGSRRSVLGATFSSLTNEQQVCRLMELEQRWR